MQQWPISVTVKDVLSHGASNRHLHTAHAQTDLRHFVPCLWANMYNIFYRLWVAHTAKLCRVELSGL